MKKDFNLKEILIPAAALLAICVAATFLLSLTNSVTSSRIEVVQKEASDTARKKVCPKASSFELCDEDDKSSVYSALNDNGEEIGYAVSVMDKSYGGDIEVMTGLDSNGNVTGIEILSINDTPGLGLNAKKDDFKNQYIGKTGGELVAAKQANADEIQAITGATRTSEAVTRCVNKAYDLVFGEGGK